MKAIINIPHQNDSSSFAIIPVTDDAMLTDVAKLARAIWQEHFTPIIGKAQVEYMLTHLQSKKAMAEQIHDGYIYFKLVKSGHLCGYCAIRKEGERLFLSKLYIQKDYRGMGLSSKTFRFLKELCRNDHLHTIYLTCNKYNSSTLAIYKHAGF